MISIEQINDEAGKVDTSPTKPQKEAGNYRMGHVSVKGMKIAIENPRGSRRYYGDDGDYVVMNNHYGYFNITKGKDGDAVDVFLGPDIEDFENVYCIDQNDTDGNFDETKVMLGFKSKEQAKRAYLSNYSKGWKGFRDITEVSLKVFKRWLYRGRKQRQPFADYVYIQRKKIDEEMENSKMIRLTESDIARMVSKAVKSVLSEGRNAEYQPTQEDWDDFGFWKSSDEPDLWQDEMSDHYNGLLVDADDEGEGYTRDYMAGMRYAKNLIAKSRVPEGLADQLEELEDNGEINAFQLGMLDALTDV